MLKNQFYLQNRPQNKIKKVCRSEPEVSVITEVGAESLFEHGCVNRCVSLQIPFNTSFLIAWKLRINGRTSFSEKVFLQMFNGGL